MLTITLPSIAVQKVQNGFVVEWVQMVPAAERKGSERTRHVAAVAMTEAQLIELIQAASKEVEQAI